MVSLPLPEREGVLDELVEVRLLGGTVGREERCVDAAAQHPAVAADLILDASISIHATAIPARRVGERLRRSPELHLLEVEVISAEDVLRREGIRLVRPVRSPSAERGGVDVGVGDARRRQDGSVDSVVVREPQRGVGVDRAWEPDARDRLLPVELGRGVSLAPVQRPRRREIGLPEGDGPGARVARAQPRRRPSRVRTDVRTPAGGRHVEGPQPGIVEVLRGARPRRGVVAEKAGGDRLTDIEIGEELRRLQVGEAAVDADVGLGGGGRPGDLGPPGAEVVGEPGATVDLLRLRGAEREREIVGHVLQRGGVGVLADETHADRVGLRPEGGLEDGPDRSVGIEPQVVSACRPVVGQDDGRGDGAGCPRHGLAVCQHLACGGPGRRPAGGDVDAGVEVERRVQHLRGGECRVVAGRLHAELEPDVLAGWQGGDDHGEDGVPYGAIRPALLDVRLRGDGAAVDPDLRKGRDLPLSRRTANWKG